jgi:hypothetical protein
MSTDELHEHASERKRYVDDQPVFVAAEIKDDAVVAHEIDGTSELLLYLGWICPLCFGGNREPGTDRVPPILSPGSRPCSRSRASDILDGDVPGPVFLPGPDFDLDMAAESCQKAYEPLEGNFGEFSAQDFRQLGLRGSNPPRGGALGQSERRDCFVQPKDEFSL